MNKKILTQLKQAREMVDIGQCEKAERLCHRILKRNPKDTDTHIKTEANVILAESYYFRQRYDDAINIFKTILKHSPEHPSTRIFLFACYKASSDLEGMLNLGLKFRDHPLNPIETQSAFVAFRDTCHWSEANKLTKTVVNNLRQGNIPLRYMAGILLDLNTIPEINASDLFDIHRYWGEQTIKESSRANLKLAQAPAPQNRIKIGYLSVDFNKHPVGQLALPVVQHHDRERFEVFCYARLIKDDGMTDAFRQAADHFIDISKQSLAQTARNIADDGIHILVDLSGHTANSPMGVMAFKPAPVQISYLGYPNTTGLSTVDYRISDQHAEAENGTRYVEQLLNMEKTFLCMRGLPNVPRSETTPAEKSDHVVFGSFNHIRKINPQVIETWSRILNTVNHSRMLIKSSGCHLDVIKNNVLQEFHKHGIAAERIEFATYMNSYEDHAALYNSVDIALDTFPYHGTHTTCEALWMGVPVITLEGKTHVQRVSSSILKCIGFDSTITQSTDAYVAKAVDLASRPANLSFLRKCIHTLFKHSLIFHPEQVTRQLEDKYIQAWETSMGTTLALGEQSQAIPPTQSSSESSLDARITLATMLSEASGIKDTTIAEIGARILDEAGEGQAAEIFHNLEHAKVIAFEADHEACQKINAITDQITADITAYPYALGHKKGAQTLYITQDGMCSSLYKPNETLMRRFEGLEVAYLKKEIPIDVISLDEFMQSENIRNIDFIKIDIQGAELDVFKGGEQALQGVIGICTEIEWAELYEGQPLFADVDSYLRQHGFQVHHFINSGSRPMKGTNLPGIQQNLWTDAVYFPSFKRIDSLASDKLIKLAIMATLYDAYDLSLHALRVYDDQHNNSKLATLFYNCFHPEQQLQTKATDSPSLSIKIAGDVKITVPNDLNLMTPYVLTEQQDWFEDEIKFIRKLIKPGMKVLDIGANYGCYAMTFAKLIGDKGHLWAFEPASTTAGFLAKSIKANGFENTTLIKAALSNRTGMAELSLETNSELNSIAETGKSGQSESVPLMTLDDCMKSRQWRNIEFIKLDAEGEEIHILEGGQKFFAACSPLVMFELKHGDQVNEGLIQKFESMDYHSYILIPGMQTLAPFNHSETPDGYLLNLFCCKADTAQMLSESGLLILEEDHGNIPAITSWQQTLSKHAYASPLMTQWQSPIDDIPLKGWQTYELALNHYASSQVETNIALKVLHLQQSFIHLVSLLEVQVSLPRLMSLVRVATELGHRSIAVQVLNQITQHLTQDNAFNPSEPFLAVSKVAQETNTDERLADWCLASVLAAKEKLQAFSSYFTAQTALPGIEHFLQLGYQDDEMMRRKKLIQQRFNL